MRDKKDDNFIEDSFNDGYDPQDSGADGAGEGAGFDKSGSEGYADDGYDEGGYDSDGYAGDGYDEGGYGSDGYAGDGYGEEEYDSDSHDSDGYDGDIYGSDGYADDGYGEGGYDSDSYADDSYADEGYGSEGYADDGYGSERYAPDEYDTEEYGSEESTSESAEPSEVDGVDVDSIPEEELAPYYDREAFKWLKTMNRAKLIRLCAMLVFSVAVLIFASIAWFTMNRDVGTSGMGVKVAAIPFELTSTGTVTQDYLDLFEFADDTYGEGSPVAGAANTYSTKGSPKLIWRLNAGNGSSYTDGFRPGSSGSLTFKIVPNVDEEMYVDCKFSVRTFVATYDENDEDEIESLDEVNLTTGTDDQKAAFRYLNGHILFFEDRTVSGDNETYTGFIGADGLKVHIPANTSAGQSVTVYWKWINTIDQLVLKSTDDYQDYPLFADDNRGDRDDAIDYINEKYDDIFAEMTGATSAVFEADGISYSYVTTPANESFLSAILDNYNTADQIIGQNVDYFLLEMSAERGTVP